MLCRPRTRVWGLRRRSALIFVRVVYLLMIQVPAGGRSWRETAVHDAETLILRHQMVVLRFLEQDATGAGSGRWRRVRPRSTLFRPPRKACALSR